jgi:hypothetical protein
MPQSCGMDILTNQTGGTQPQTNAPSSADSAGKDRDLKQESRRNKKLRFRQFNKPRRAE